MGARGACFPENAVVLMLVVLCGEFQAGRRDSKRLRAEIT